MVARYVKDDNVEELFCMVTAYCVAVMVLIIELLVKPGVCKGST